LSTFILSAFANFSDIIHIISGSIFAGLVNLNYFPRAVFYPYPEPLDAESLNPKSEHPTLNSPRPAVNADVAVRRYFSFFTVCYNGSRRHGHCRIFKKMFAQKFLTSQEPGDIYLPCIIVYGVEFNR
jgi:hypothetical protein